MIDFSDLPYRYFPPRRHVLIAWCLRLFNRWRHLPRTERIAVVETTGQEAVLAARCRKDRVVLLPEPPQSLRPQHPPGGIAAGGSHLGHHGRLRRLSPEPLECLG